MGLSDGRAEGDGVLGWVQEGVKGGFLAMYGANVCVRRGCYVCLGGAGEGEGEGEGEDL